MKRFWFVPLVIVLSLSLSGCAALHARLSGDRRPTVITTLFPQYDFVRAIAGDKVNVRLLLPPGVEAHAFEPTPRDIADIGRANMFVYTNRHMEPWAARVIEAAGNRNLVVVDASQNIHVEAKEDAAQPYEWLGVYELGAGDFQLLFSKVDGAYADPNMMIALISSPYTGQDALDAAKHEGEALFFDAAPTKVTHGGIVAPFIGVYLLEFDPSRDTTAITVRIETTGTFVLLTAHLPSEFEGGTHFFKTAAGRDVIAVAEYPDHKDDHAHEHGVDPHIWLDPLMAQQMVDNIVAGLSQADPDNADFFRHNGETYKHKLYELHNQFASFFAAVENRTIIYAGHFAFGHFARRYNLQHESPYVGFSPDAEPTPRRIAELIQNVREAGSRAIFYEALVDPRVARAIVEATGVRMLLLHGAHNVSREELQAGATYLSIMETNLVNLREGLR